MCTIIQCHTETLCITYYNYLLIERKGITSNPSFNRSEEFRDNNQLLLLSSVVPCVSLFQGLVVSLFQVNLSWVMNNHASFCYHHRCMVITCSKSMHRPGKVVNPARGQLNRENEFFPVHVRAWEFLRIWSREMGSAVPSRVSLLIAILRLNLVLTYGIPPEFRGGVQFFI